MPARSHVNTPPVMAAGSNGRMPNNRLSKRWPECNSNEKASEQPDSNGPNPVTEHSDVDSRPGCPKRQLNSYGPCAATRNVA